MTTTSGHTRAIRASRVIGTKVVSADGEDCGRIEDIVLDKLSNEIMFAVAGDGGVFGVGEKLRPLPWSALDYDKDKDAYVVNAPSDRMKSAPADSFPELTRDDGRAARDAAHRHFGVQ